MREQAIAERFIGEVMQLYKGCTVKGGFTPEAAAFYDRYQGMSGADIKMKELFNVSL